MTDQLLETRCCISLGLQGGGSFGAFTWGVLDRLLEAEVALDVISGASAGAVNAVLLADGMIEGGRDGARARLRRFWHRVGAGGIGIGPMASWSLEALVSRMGSPFQLNPLGLNPLRDLLAETVDFARLRAASPVRLLIAATRVRDGHARLFREDEVTLDAVLASACLPFLQHAVEIEGEAYWDGGYSANPPLRQLVVDTEAVDILLVRLVPELHESVPHLSHEISRRVREIGFNASLQREQEAVEELRRACGRRRIFRSELCRKLDALKFHEIAAPEVIEDLAQASTLDTSWPFLQRLCEGGRIAAEGWLGRFRRG
ncbi:MAG TPA: patatin-like phospholipase family protein [Acetobacteraceae bacterium]